MNLNKIMKMNLIFLKTNGEELVNINSELLGSTPFDIQIDKTALQTRKETETEVTIKNKFNRLGLYCFF